MLPLLTKLHVADNHQKPSNTGLTEEKEMGIMEEKIAKLCHEKGAENLEGIASGLCYSHKERGG